MLAKVVFIDMKLGYYLFTIIKHCHPVIGHKLIIELLNFHANTCSYQLLINWEFSKSLKIDHRSCVSDKASSAVADMMLCVHVCKCRGIQRLF